MSTIVIRGASDSSTVNVEDGALLSRPKSDFEIARDAGYAFAWTGDTYDYAANDTILGVENNSSTRDLYIEKIVVSGDTASQFVVHTSSAVTMAGTARTGVNLNRNSNITDTGLATAKRDETGNGQQAASYTGGLISGRFANNGVVTIEVGGAIRLAQDHNIGIDLTTDGTACVATIWGYFKAN